MHKHGKEPAPRARGRTAVVERPEAPARPTSEIEAAPAALWSIAMLRIAMELKRPDAPGLESIIDGVVAKMGLDKAQFEKYLAEHLGTLKEAVRSRGYAG